MIDFLLQPEIIIALFTLTFLEIVLGIDNIIFISILVNKLSPELQRKATFFGLVLAMVQRIILLFFMSYLIHLKTLFFEIDTEYFSSQINWQSLIFLFGGLFLIYKSTMEIYEKVEQKEQDIVVKKKYDNLFKSLIQISLIDFIFSIDSILTALGMTNGISPDSNHSLIIMVTAVILSIIVMMFYANPIRVFIKKHPSIQILGLSFMILIGFMLVSEAAHTSNTILLGAKVGVIPKGYLYFAIIFSILVEALNIKSKKSNP